MKNWYLSFVFLGLFLIPSLAYGANWYDSNWLNARSITIDGTDIDTANLIDYPLYVNITSLNVGTDTQADCDDIVFTNYQNTTKFAHEIENCDATNDFIEAWVKVPIVYHANNTQFFMYYDNAGATDQQQTQATWSSNFQQVLHVNNTLLDSTNQGNDGDTNEGSTNQADEYIGDSRHFDGINDEFLGGLTSGARNIFDGGGSISMWINANSDGGGSLARSYDAANTATAGFYVDVAQDDGSHLKIGFNQRGSGTGGNQHWITNNREAQLNNWSLVTITFNDDSTSNNPLIYVNGTSVSITEDVTMGAGSFTNAGGDFHAGDNYASDVRMWDGEIDEIRLNSITLTAEWIKADWECQRGAVINDNNSCITIGAEGSEPAAGGNDHPRANSDTQAHEDLVSRQMQYNRANSDTLAHSESVVASVISALNRTPDDVLAQAESVVAFVNDLTQVLSDTLAQSESVSRLCTGTCGVQPTLNTVVLRIAPPTEIRLGGIFAGVCDFANNYTMIGVWPNGTIRCMQLP